MHVSYELYDKEGEPLINLEGKEYIAPIGSIVCFYDNVSEGEEFVSVEFFGKVISYQYNIELDTLCIDCETVQDLNENDDSILVKYNKLKFKKSC